MLGKVWFVILRLIVRTRHFIRDLVFILILVCLVKSGFSWHQVLLVHFIVLRRRVFIVMGKGLLIVLLRALEILIILFSRALDVVRLIHGRWIHSLRRTWLIVIEVHIFLLESVFKNNLGLELGRVHIILVHEMRRSHYSIHCLLLLLLLTTIVKIFMTTITITVRRHWLVLNGWKLVVIVVWIIIINMIILDVVMWACTFQIISAFVLELAKMMLRLFI